VNRDQVKERLLGLRKTVEEFEVIFSGKKSRKVDGLYKPASREIILHTGNFTTDDELVYTAIHEYAHHLQFTGSAVPVSAKAHTIAFWSLFHELLFEAERTGFYHSPFEGIPAFAALTREIREKFLTTSGSLMKELGRLLVRAHELCEQHGTNFGDYVDRVLGLPRTSAQLIMKAHRQDLDPRVGFENMRSLTGIRDDGDRAKAQAALLAGRTPDMVKAAYGTRPKPKNPRAELEEERARIRRTIRRLQERLKEIDRRLDGEEG
jgi:hypothetical protein